MTNYVVTVEPSNTLQSPWKIDLKVKHFRQYSGRKAMSGGGHSIIFNLNDGLVFSSKCHENDQFDKRKGILTCLQKMFNSPAYPVNGWIMDVVFEQNGCRIWLDQDLEPEKQFWWLRPGISVGSGLYAPA